MMVLRSSAARMPGSARDSRCRRPPFDLLDSSSEFISLESPSLSRRRIWTRSEAPSAAARAAGSRITRGEFSSGQIECFSEHCLRSMRKNMPPCSDSSFDKSMEILSENVSRRLFRRQLEKQKLDHKKEYKEASRTLKMRADANTEEQDHEDNGDLEVRRSCRLQQSRYTTTNESVLFDKLVTNTAEAVLQKMDDIEKMCRRQEMENRGMFRDAKENISMYSQRRKEVQRAAEETDDNQVSSEEEEEEEVEYTRKRYSLRKRKAVERYQAPLERPRQHEGNFGSCSSRVTQRHSLRSAQSQGHKRTNRQRHRAISEISDSTSYTSSDDEEHFGKQRKLTNARHLRRCLPLNSQKNELNRIDSNQSKHGASPSDVEPMQIDSSIRFDSVGGLSDHIAALKEIIVFPLVYPEVLERLKIQPPRGCLFYGPPGTGKTLIARALANECSQGDRKVSFFMRKGADCLSKWVGESEQQLRSLFDQAYQMQPSIIFFDEIDGLAPVRSSKQDQIYSSIVSTLLALMDGLDSRGEVVVIGATNRLDSIDPALRRPGRFDREFLFSLPNKEARKEIFQIHTRNWIPKPSGTFLEELAEKCVGYCGADIKSLCTEAALSALRRCYPQIYKSTKKLRIDVASIKIIEVDFEVALQKTVASSQKAVASPGQPLAPVLKPLLDNTLTRILQALRRVFPHTELALKKHQQQGGLNCVLRNDANDSGSESPAIFEDKTVHKRPGTQKEKILSFGRNAYCQPTACRPRFLLVGEPGYGQTSHLAPALMHALEKFPVYNLDLSSLLVGITSPEERCAQLMQEAQRRAPSIIYIPQIHLWWESVGASLKSTFSVLLQNIPAFAPVLLLATSDVPYVELPKEIEDLFINKEEVFKIRLPHREERRMFFEDLLVNQAARCPASENNAVISKSKCKRDKESSGIATKRRKFQFNKENKVPEDQNDLDSDTEDCCVMGENAMCSEREMDAHKQPGTGCYWEFEQLLDYVAERTKKFTIFQLEKLYALLSQCIYQQRDDDNKTKLLQEMKKEIAGFNYLQ